MDDQIKSQIDQANILLKLVGIECLAMYRPYGPYSNYMHTEKLNGIKYGIISAIKKSTKYKDEWEWIQANLEKRVAARMKINPSKLALKPYWLGFGRPSFVIGDVKYYSSFEEIEQIRNFEPQPVHLTAHDLIFTKTICYKSYEAMLASVQCMVNARIAS